MNIKLQCTNIIPYINGLLQTNDNWVYNAANTDYGQITAEAFNNLISNTKTYRSKDPSEDFNTYITKYLQWLDRKIEAANRSYSMWDAYKIQNVSHNKGDIATLVANLGYNSSIVCGIPDKLYINNKLENIYSGDIILRDSTGILHLIPGASNGCWKPRYDIISNHIIWSFDTSGDGASVEMAPTYTTQSTSGNEILGVGESCRLRAFSSRPVVEAYIDGERAYNVYSISFDSNTEQYIITNLTSITIAVYWK